MEYSLAFQHCYRAHIPTCTQEPEDLRRELDLWRDLNRINSLAKSRRHHSYYAGFAFYEAIRGLPWWLRG